MSQETIAMSKKERERLVLMRQVLSGQLLLKEAACKMRVSARQAVRIKKRFLGEGAEGLVHRSRGMPSNRKTPPKVRQEVLGIYKERYGDYGPTLASEKLLDRHKIRVARETLRRWLVGACLWRVGAKERVHRTKRQRCERFGEMVQLDGSEHDWFEGRGAKCTLMVLIDDAMGKIALHMAPQETTESALTVLRKWIEAHGVPESIYADRRTIYFTEEFLHNRERRDDPAVFTQFMQVANRLNIEMIPAYSPQAKGRVERMNGTLQDRLVKEFRERGIDTVEAANAMLDAFAEEINRRFGQLPAKPADAHRAAPRGKEQWDECFCVEHTRVVQRDNTVSYGGEQWQIVEQAGAPRPGSRITVRQPLSGGLEWLWENRRLSTRYLGRSGVAGTVRMAAARRDSGSGPAQVVAARRDSGSGRVGFSALESKDVRRGRGALVSSPRPSSDPALALGSLPSGALPSRQAHSTYGTGEALRDTKQKMGDGR